MRTTFGLLIGIAWYSTTFGQELNVRSKPVKLMGDETQLIRVKAEPQKFLGKPLVLTGGVRISDYYNYGYRDAEDSHYSLDFYQALTPTEISRDDCNLYLRRDIGEKIIEKLLSKTTSNNFVRIRAKVVLDPTYYEDGSWELLELLDVQFAADGGKDWEQWFIETQSIVAAEAEAQAKQAAVEATELAKKKREKAKDEERAARTRTWKDASGKFSVVAEYRGMSGDKVILKNKDGNTLRVPIDRLSNADQEWLEERRKTAQR